MDSQHLDITRRLVAFMRRHQIDKHQFMTLTEGRYSEDQWYRWVSLDNGSSPKMRDIQHICCAIDLSPSYLLHGIGPELLSDLERMCETYEALQKTGVAM